MRFEKSRTLVAGSKNGFEATLTSNFHGTGVVWTFKETEKTVLVQLIAAGKSRKFPTQNDLAANFGVTKGEITKRKQECLAMSLITSKEWADCLADACSILVEEDEPSAKPPF